MPTVRQPTTVISIMLISLLLTACATGADVLPDTSTRAAETPADADVESATPTASDATASAADVTITPLTLTERGDNVLERIDAAVAELGDPLRHRFVTTTEVDVEMAVQWQGEALAYPAQLVLFLQPVQSGGNAAVRLDVPVDMDAAPDIDATIESTISAVRDADALRELAAAATAPAPDVEIPFVRARQTGDGVWTFDVTINHPDTGWADYVDGWHVATPDGEILGTRILLHPHVNEMPFTRSLSGVAIPADINEVHMRSHDRISGYSPDVAVVPIGETGSGERYDVVR